jgi:hypothetical protein
MNGPVILNNARELLAHEIFGYRELKPSPLKISPWLAMSLLQKAVRRGESELAQRAAATLLLIADYESEDRTFESFRARHLSSSHVVDFQNGLKCAQTKICI